MRVLVADKLAAEAVEVLRKVSEVVEAEPSPEELLEIIGDFDAIVVRSRTKVTGQVIERGANLKVIGRAGVGVDNIDVAFATERGIPVVNAPTGSTSSVAELAVGHIVSLARHIPQADASMKGGKWEKKRFKGIELEGKVLGFVGVGRIGAHVARIAQAMGMETIACDPYIPDDVAQKMCVECIELGDCIRRSDFVTIHCILNDETRGMIGEEQLRSMKKTAYLVNCARGGIVDEAALYKALTEGWIAGAALDVYEDEPPKDRRLVELPNLICTPHIGASTVEAQIKAGTITAEQMNMVLRGERPELCVNREVLG